MQQLVIGGKFPQIDGREEGTYFETDGSGLILIYNFISPTRKEIESMGESNPFEIKFTTIENVLFVLSKCGNLNWTESPYTPHLSGSVNDLQKPTEKNEGLLLTLIMVDAVDNTIKSLRAVGLGHEFSCDIYEEIKNLQRVPFVPDAYFDVIQTIQLKYRTDYLAKRAENSYKIN